MLALFHEIENHKGMLMSLKLIPQLPCEAKDLCIPGFIDYTCFDILNIGCKKDLDLFFSQGALSDHGPQCGNETESMPRVLNYFFYLITINALKLTQINLDSFSKFVFGLTLQKNTPNMNTN